MAACLSAAALEPASDPAAPAPDFNRQVRPILSDHCFACHGPDANERQADLRLDTADGLAGVVEAGNIDGSELIARIDAEDPDLLMPPAEFQKPLSNEQKQILRQWVDSGAEVQQHWAFVRPQADRKPSAAEDDNESGVSEAATSQESASPIDHFINRGIEESGLQANGRADRSEILRRVCLDLTGLPPSREQIDSFLADPSSDAYGRLVDELLESPHFGEHFGRYWLDLVRYADTHGLHLDNYREMWPYRDWVIDAFNANMPFDQFITHQLAGDLIPDADESSKIASGFNRLNVTTNEGGSIYEEVFARNVIDRTDAFGTIFLGLTTGCAVCHDHKFDPISMRDYYSLSAFFNSLDGRAMDGNAKDPAPVIRVPTDEQQQLLAEYDESLRDLQRKMLGPIESVDQAQRSWERSLVDDAAPQTELLRPLEVQSESDTKWRIRDDGSVELEGEAAAKETVTIVADLPSGVQWQTLKLEALVEEAEQRVGVSENGNVVLSEITVETTDSLSPGKWIKVPIVHGFADIEQSDGPFAVRYAIDSKINDSEGWAAAGHQQPGGRSAWFVLSPLIAEGDSVSGGDDGAAGEEAQLRVKLHYQSKYARHLFRRVRLSLSDSVPQAPADQKIALGEMHSIGPFPVESANPGYGRSFASQQGEFRSDEVFNHEDRPYRWQHRGDLPQVHVNTLPSIKDRASVVVLHQGIDSPSPQKATLLIGSDDGFVVYLNGKQVGSVRGPRELNPLSNEYELELKKGKNDLYIKVVNHNGPSQLTYAFRSPAIDVPGELVQLVAIAPEDRGEEVEAALRKYYRKVYCLHPDWLALVDHEKGTRKAQEDLRAEVATTLVWKELSEPRQAHILKRGQYDQPGEAVDRATPAFLPVFPADAPRDRLGLAKWLTSPDHPLTARVAVNRFWQHLFGTGLVKTSEDFGSQGEPPSHPELLDYLAIDFQQNGWDVKQLIRAIVTSEAYCRSADVTEAMRRLDPANRLLARGPRHRLDAEVLRDQALFLSGMLVDRQGGPSVKPPQPDGLWFAVGYSGSNTVRFSADSGDKVYRRSVYTFWKRTSPPPQMATFDAPSRESCTARRERTNTPLQALLMMNETQYVEAAQHLARRALAVEGLKDDAERIEWLFQTVTARIPSARESSQLQSLLRDTAAYYNQDPALATKLVGTSDDKEAAWTIVASTLLNLDEVISK
jgi:hypothetical protein